MSKSLFFLGASALSLLSTVNAVSYIQYSTVTGYFLQDDAATDPSTFDYTATNFGLINQTYDSDAVFDPLSTKSQWERFENQVNVLNGESAAGVEYKVLYIGRHGEGYHNAAETYYGTPAWNCYWSELDGNGTSVWADAKITPNGAAQAQIANTFWASQITNHKQSLPESYYTSPLTRCLQTANITFYGLTQDVPTVKEFFREGISMHTCDRRSSKTYIQQNFPGYKFEAGFTEEDELWRGIEAETSAAQDVRSKKVLDDVFSSDSKTFLSITTHSGETASILRVVGHRTFRLATGAVIPVLIKAQTIEGSPASSSIASWAAEATCTVPPITSLATGGCVCPSTTSSTSPATITASVTSTGTGSQASPTGFNSTAIYTNSTSTQIASSSTSLNVTSTFTNPPSATSTTNAVTTVDQTTASTSAVVTSAITSSETVIVQPTSGATPKSSASEPLRSSSHATSVPLTTSVVYTTQIVTVTSCAATVTHCPARSTQVITSTIPLYTTICPVAETTSAYAPASTTSTVYTTKIYTITSCAPTVTNCPGKIGKVTTEVVIDYTTVCPVSSSTNAHASSPPKSVLTVPGTVVEPPKASSTGPIHTQPAVSIVSTQSVQTKATSVTQVIPSQAVSTHLVIPTAPYPSGNSTAIKPTGSGASPTKTSTTLLATISTEGPVSTETPLTVSANSASKAGPGFTILGLVAAFFWL